MTASIAAALRALLAEGRSAAIVTVSEAKGPTPRERGAQMLVTAEEMHGSIGGGQLARRVIARSRAFLDRGTQSETIAMALGPELGQCCGGQVSVVIARRREGLAGRRSARACRRRRAADGAGVRRRACRARLGARAGAAAVPHALDRRTPQLNLVPPAAASLVQLSSIVEEIEHATGFAEAEIAAVHSATEEIETGAQASLRDATHADHLAADARSRAQKAELGAQDALRRTMVLGDPPI